MMRVTFRTIDEFLTDLRTQVNENEAVLQKAVRLSVTDRELDSDGIRKLVNVQVSAVVAEGEGQYLMEAGEDVGIDRLDEPPLMEGTEAAEIIRRKVTESCDDLGLRVRPGLIEI